MATTNAAISIVSTDLMDSSLSISTTATLTTAGTDTGLVETTGLAALKRASTSKIDLQESNRLSISIEALKRFSVERNVSSEQSLIFSKLLKGDITKHEIKLNAQFIGSIISNFFKGHKNQYPSDIWKKNHLHPILFTIEKIIFSEFDELDNSDNNTYKLLWILIKINPIQWTLQLICHPNKLYQYLKWGWIILGNKLNIRNKY